MTQWHGSSLWTFPTVCRPEPRHTHEWTEAELTTLETFYVLKGSAFVMARHPALTPNGIRQMATRLNLAEELTEYTPLMDVAEEAGVNPWAVREWVQANGYRKFCRLYGRQLLLPLPVIRLYLRPNRASARPRGWWGIARAADHLGVNARTVRDMIYSGKVDAVVHGYTYFVDPHSLPAPQRLPLTAVSVRDLAAITTQPRSTVLSQLKRAGHPVTVYAVPGCPGRYGAAYTTGEAARRFLSARGYHEELVEVYLRRAVMGGSKPK